MALADYFSMFLFAAVIIIAGTMFARSGSNLKSFFAGGGAIPWGISSLSLFMSFFSAGTFVVWGSIAYERGWVAVSLQWAICLAGFLVAFIIAPRWRDKGVLTAAEFLTRRFNIQTQKFYTYLFLFVSLFTTGNFLYPVAKIVSVSTGFPLTWIILVLGVSIILYTTAGGFWAVLITDVLQFIVLFSSVIIVLPLAFRYGGGMEALADKAPDSFFHLFGKEFTPEFMIAFLIYNAIFLGGNWAYVQRFTSVRDRQAARKTGIMFGLLYTISPVLWMLPPMIYGVVNPGLKGLETEGAYLMICMKVLPAGMLGLMLASMVFATASSVNTTLNMSAAVITNDLYKNRYPGTTEQKTMFFARTVTVIFGVGAIAVALMVPLMGGIVEAVLSVAAITGVPLLAPPIWALFSKRITGRMMVLTTVISLVINIYFKFVSPALFDFALSRAAEMAVGAFIPLVLLALFEFSASLRYESTEAYRNYTAKFREIPLTEAGDAGDGQAQNRFAYRVLGFTLLFIGAMFGVFGILARDTAVISLVIALVIMLCGGWLVRLGLKK